MFEGADGENGGSVEPVDPARPPADGAPARKSGAACTTTILALTAQIAELEALRLDEIKLLSQAPEMVPLPPRERPDGSTYKPLTVWSMVQAEMRAALHLGDREAGRLVDTSLALADRLRRTSRALNRGRLDYRRASLMAELIQPLADHHYRRARRAGLSPERAEQAAAAIAARVEGMVLGAAAGQSWWELRIALLKALFTVDPEYAELMRKSAQSTRSVSARTNIEDGTGDLYAHLSAAETQSIYTIVDGYARLARSRGDTRTLDQLRADAFAHICLNGSLPGPDNSNGTQSPSNAEDSGSAGDDCQAGEATRPSEQSAPSSASWGAAPATSSSTAPDAPSGNDTASTSDKNGESGPVTSAGADGGADNGETADNHGCAGCGDQRTGRDTDQSPAGSHTESRQSSRKVRKRNRSRGPERTPGRLRPRPEIQVMIDAGTLLALNDRPGHLHGHGPITADYARALAGLPGALYRRLVTDPLTGQLLDRGRNTYRPSDALSDHVTVRDMTCRHPGCTRPATNCDADHIIPYPVGATCEENLCSICRHDHRLKHEGRWHHELSTDPAHAPGTVIYTSPAGQKYCSEPARLTPSSSGTDELPFPDEAQKTRAPRRARERPRRSPFTRIVNQGLLGLLTLAEQSPTVPGGLGSGSPVVHPPIYLWLGPSPDTSPVPF